jgi:DNA primase
VRNFQEKYLTGEHKRKYCPLTTHVNGKLVTLLHPLGDNFYGIFENQQCIRECKQVIVFEGEKSVVKMHGFYGENNNSLAICGSALSGMKISLNKQMQLLMGLGVETIVIAYDKLFELFGNSEELKKRKIMSEKMQVWKLLFNVKVIWDTEGLLEKGDSPVDKGIEVFEKLLGNAVDVK